MADVKPPEIASNIKKKLMYVNRKAPYGTIYALESLEVVLISAAFEQDVSLAFLDDGVYQLMKGQNTSGIGMKNFSPTFKALGDYEIKIARTYDEVRRFDAGDDAPENLHAVPRENCALLREQAPAFEVG